MKYKLMKKKNTTILIDSHKVGQAKPGYYIYLFASCKLVITK